MVSVGDVLALAQTLTQLVFDIVQAKEEVDNLPERTKALVRQVEIAGKALEYLEAHAEASDPTKTGLLCSILNDLGRELVQAHEKVAKFQQKSADVAKRSKLWEVAKAYWTLGAAKMNKQTNEITEDIRKLLVDLNQAISLETHAAVLMLVQTRGGNSNFRDENATEYPVVSMLDKLELGCLEDELCKVDLMIADSHSYDFRGPNVEERVASTQQDNRRGAREGGFEIRNCTKIQLVISIEDDKRFLNIVIYDNHRNTPPELFFPKSSGQNCELSCDFKRQFPNSTAYKSDPLSFKLEKDAKLGPDEVAMQSIYVVLTTKKLKAKDDSKILKFENLEEHLDDEDVFVRRLLFDIK